MNMNNETLAMIRTQLDDAALSRKSGSAAAD
jgi:hypothetical protein